MNFLDKLNLAVDAPEAIYIKYLQQYKFKERTVHFFFEGSEDRMFFKRFIEYIYEDTPNLFYYVCEGKSNVYQNYNDINWNIYAKNRSLFFIDKDIDDYLFIEVVKDLNVFITKYYSIENYVVNSDIYKDFLFDLCSIKDESVISTLTDKFNEQLMVFYDLVLYLSAWIIHCRRNGYRMNLNDIDLSKIYFVNEDMNIVRNVVRPFNSMFAYIHKATKLPRIDLLNVFKIARELKKDENYKAYIRGKYDIWFLYAFCKKTVNVILPKLNEDIKKRNEASDQKIPKCSIHVELKMENIFNVLAPRLSMPEDIRDFLVGHFRSLNN